MAKSAEATRPGDRTAGEVWDETHRQLTIGLIATVSMTAFEAMAVATVLPATVADIGGVTWYGWAFSAFMLANLVGTSVCGRMADQRGAAPPFVMGVTLFVGGLLGAGISPTMPLLVLGRAAQGFGAGAISSIGYLAVARAYAPNARPRMMALLSSAWVVPGLIGPAVAGTIADHLSWRWIFLGLAPISVAAAGWTTPALRRLGPSGASEAPDRTLTALRLAVGAGAALFALDGHSIMVAAPLVAAGLVIGTPALRELVPHGTLRAAGGPPAAIAALALVSAAFFGTEAFLPLSLTSLRGQSTTVAGLTLTAATLSWTTGAWVQARLAARISRRSMALAGLALTLTGIAGVAVIVSPAAPVLVAPVSWGISGMGMGLAYSTLVLEALEGASAGQEGETSAAVQLGNVLGIAMGTGLAGATLTFASASWSHAAGLAMVGCLTVGLAVAALLTGFRLSRGDR